MCDCGAFNGHRPHWARHIFVMSSSSSRLLVHGDTHGRPGELSRGRLHRCMRACCGRTTFFKYCCAQVIHNRVGLDYKTQSLLQNPWIILGENAVEMFHLSRSVIASSMYATTVSSVFVVLRLGYPFCSFAIPIPGSGVLAGVLFFTNSRISHRYANALTLLVRAS